MRFVAHRINTVEELTQLPTEYGVELDLRESGDRLILQHDPFGTGEDFEEYLKHYRHGLLILDIKCERIEHRVLDLVRRFEIPQWTFYDSSLSMLHVMNEAGITNLALHFSEYGGLDTLRAFRDKAEWVWIHCYAKFSLSGEAYREMRDLGYKLCFASPELYGRPEDVEPYIETVKRNGFSFDAICTKSFNIPRWQQIV